MKYHVKFGLLAFLLMIGSTPVMATTALPNYSYSYLDINLGKINYDPGVVLAGYNYDELGFAQLEGSYAFHPNFSVNLTSRAATNSGGNTEVTITGTSIGLQFNTAVNQADINVGIDFGNSEIEVCVSSFCPKDDTDFTSFTIGTRYMVDSSMELNAEFDHTEFDVDSVTANTVTIGAAYNMSMHHRFSFGYEMDNGSDDSTFALGYRYNFS